MEKYLAWLKHVKIILVTRGLMKSSVDLCPKSWRMYFDDGMKPIEAVKEDIGNFKWFESWKEMK